METKEHASELTGEDIAFDNAVKELANTMITHQKVLRHRILEFAREVKITLTNHKVAQSQQQIRLEEDEKYKQTWGSFKVGTN